MYWTMPLLTAGVTDTVSRAHAIKYHAYHNNSSTDSTHTRALRQKPESLCSEGSVGTVHTANVQLQLWPRSHEIRNGQRQCAI